MFQDSKLQLAKLSIAPTCRCSLKWLSMDHPPAECSGIKTPAKLTSNGSAWAHGAAAEGCFGALALRGRSLQGLYSHRLLGLERAQNVAIPQVMDVLQDRYSFTRGSRTLFTYKSCMSQSDSVFNGWT